MQQVTALLLGLLLVSFNVPLFLTPTSNNGLAAIQSQLSYNLERETDFQWVQFFDNMTARHPRSITECRTGGFVVAGFIVESAIGLSDEHAWMAKIDLFGEVEWER
ncbi:MAG: hypothetical protein ACFE9D_12695, partial [Promethearchaeota archaeon]